MTRSLRRLTDSLDAIVAATDDPDFQATSAAFALRAALQDPGLLAPEHREPWPDRFRPHLVHVHPEGKYSVVSFVWLPGQRTSIHDHRCWCVVGVWRGFERETSYDFGRDATGEYLVRRGFHYGGRGTVSVLVPPDEDIHVVENAGNEVAISLHLYGDDIGVHGSSVNRVFPAELVRVGASPVAGQSWRAVERAA
jgi:3-mercaptopropionate dioxygenase